ncbi:MAG TPA: hypothetical protein VGB76_17900 [Pyrinomonadaceae bacterium]|jgi:hypothetical protein
MTDEERQRQMDFILDSLARLTATTSQLAESHARDHARIARLEESFVILTDLAGSYGERLGGVEEAVAELRRLSGSEDGGLQP